MATERYPDNRLRSLEEVRRYLKLQNEQLNLDEQLAQKSVASLKAMGKEADAHHLKAKTYGIPVDFLADYHASIDYLNNRYQAIVAMENEVILTTKAKAPLLSSFTKLKANVETMMHQVFSALDEVSAKCVPEAHRKFAGTLSKELCANTHLQADSSKVLTYAYPSVGKPAFATYIVLSNCISDSGKVAPHLYVTLRAADEGMDVHVSHEFVPPNQLQEGVAVKSAHHAAKMLSMLLTKEGFSTERLAPTVRLTEAAARLRALRSSGK